MVDHPGFLPGRTLARTTSVSSLVGLVHQLAGQLSTVASFRIVSWCTDATRIALNIVSDGRMCKSRVNFYPVRVLTLALFRLQS